MKRRVALITGVAGFAGSWLAEELLTNGFSVCGSVLPGESLDNIAQIKSDLKLTKLDILDSAGCKRVIMKIKPDFIFHLAAFSSVGQSFKHDRLAYRVNLDGTLNMLEASIAYGKLKKFVFTSSADCYGTFKPENKTLTESQPLNPISPYAISKVAAEQASLFYFHHYGLRVNVARSFNHAGPRQNENFVIPSFARQIVDIEMGRQKPVIMTGGLTARRDLSDVRDIVRGYRLLAEKGRPGEVYQFCSGKAHSIEQVLDRLLSLSRVRIKIGTDMNRVRKNDIPLLRGSNRKAVQELGFETRYKLSETLQDSLDYFRTKLSGQS